MHKCRGIFSSSCDSGPIAARSDARITMCDHGRYPVVALDKICGFDKSFRFQWHARAPATCREHCVCKLSFVQASMPPSSVGIT